MSTIQDIRGAKWRFDNHAAIHRCKAGQCPTRVHAWLAYMSTAERWGRDGYDRTEAGSTRTSDHQKELAA